jgi:hypothetical protein
MFGTSPNRQQVPTSAPYPSSRQYEPPFSLSYSSLWTGKRTLESRTYNWNVARTAVYLWPPFACVKHGRHERTGRDEQAGTSLEMGLAWTEFETKLAKRERGAKKRT